MPLSGFSDFITPVDHFFVRTHVYVPTVELSQWRLKVDGEVASPLTWTMDDLKKLPSIELVSVLECAGNGRAFYNPTVPGQQWQNGGVANGRWRGVRLAEVLRKAGIKDSAKEILFDGADAPIGKMADFQRTITVKKALDSNTILAYDMNGAALPVKHGFPLRVVAPGWASDSWTKWVTSISVLDHEFDGFWMVNASGSRPSCAAGNDDSARSDGACDRPAGEERDRVTVQWRTDVGSEAGYDPGRSVERRHGPCD